MSMHSVPADIRRDWIRTLLANQKPRHSLQQPFYRDPDLFQAEMEWVIERQWHLAALECEIAEPGQYVTFEIGESSVIVCRNRDGAIKAHYNSCRHRGSALCDAAKGKRTTFVCPYHHWSYDLDGNLIRAPNMGNDLDKASHGLKSVHVKTVSGLVLISLADSPPDISAFEAAFTPMALPHKIAETRIAKEIVLHERANWKLVWENARECDHCQAGHPELMNTLQLFNFENPWDDPYIAAFWRRCEASGLPSATRDGHGFRVGRVPLQEGHLSITMDGKAACARTLGDWPDSDIGSVRFAMYPSMFAHIHADYMMIVSIMPVGPQETRITARWVVHEDAIEGVDYDLERMVEVWRETNLQDQVFCERNQRGVNARGYEPGPYAQPSEFGVWTFVDWYRAEMARAVA